MNIEEYKKDWEQHCEEHGVKGYIFVNDYRNYITFSLLKNHYKDSINMTLSFKYLGIERDIKYENDFTFDSHIYHPINIKYIAIMTSFYEKLMKGQEDGKNTTEED